MEDRDIYEYLYRLLCSKGYRIVCVGSELREDDRAGLIICRRLAGMGYNVVECPFGLESCVDKIVNEKIKKMLLIDAVVAENASPGEIVLSSIDDVVENYLVTTHSIPVSLMIKYLQTLGLCREVCILGIRVKSIGFGEEVSREVARAIDYLVDTIDKVLRECRKEEAGYNGGT